MYCPQNVKNSNYILLRIPENKGGPGNPSTPIDVNAFRTTNFQSRFALRGAEFHGNNHRDSTTRIPSIAGTSTCVSVCVCVGGGGGGGGCLLWLSCRLYPCNL